MSKSGLLRVQDVHAAYRLIGDCRDVGDDPAEWHRLALEGLCRLVGAFAATGGEGTWARPAMPCRPITAYHVGFDRAGRDRFFAYMRENGVSADPIIRQIQNIPGTITCTRRDVLADREWYRSISFNEYNKVAGCDHQLNSIHQVSSGGAITALFLVRAPGERDFSPRERRLMNFFHVELGRLLGGALVSGLERGWPALSPRLRQTLDCLLEGDSEKAVAARLGLSRATVHQYVTMLYRKFGATCRGQLMAYALKRRWPGPVRPIPMSKSALRRLRDIRATHRRF
jgi:DNA-binding CsgD family transcriptional regulator